jgi:hypothetical protein
MTGLGQWLLLPERRFFFLDFGSSESSGFLSFSSSLMMIETSPGRTKPSLRASVSVPEGVSRYWRLFLSSRLVFSFWASSSCILSTSRLSAQTSRTGLIVFRSPINAMKPMMPTHTNRTAFCQNNSLLLRRRGRSGSGLLLRANWCNLLSDMQVDQ